MTMIFHHKIKRSIMLSLVAMLTTNTYMTTPQDIQSTTPACKALKCTGFALVAASALRFFTREGDSSPSRFDWDKLAQGEDILNQGLYLIDDELLGHIGSKPYDEINKENGRLERVKTYYPKGLGGWTAYYYKSVLSALGATWVIVTATRVLALPDTTTENFIPRLTTEITLQTKNLGMNPALDVFIPTFAVIVGYKVAHATK